MDGLNNGIFLLKWMIWGGYSTHLFLVQHPDFRMAIFSIQTNGSFGWCFRLNGLLLLLKETARRIEKDGLDARSPLGVKTSNKAAGGKFVSSSAEI